MKKIYKIPMTERIVMTEKGPLIDTLKEQYPDLYKRELDRIELTYGHNNPGYITPQFQSIIDQYNEETAMLYKAMEVPQYIIAQQEDDGDIIEYSTKTKLIIRCNSTLAGREINVIQAYEYMQEIPSYEERVNQFFPSQNSKKRQKNPIKKLIKAITKKDN